MDEAEQDQHEARLKEMFNSFDATGTGSLGQEELIDLCQLLNLEEVTPALQQTLFWDNLLGRVYFDQFKEALILVLSRTLSFEEHLEEPDFLPEVQPKYIKDGKCYGRRSLPEFQKPLGKCAEVRVLESLNEEAQSSLTTASDYNEYHKTQHSEEYEAEGQLRFWNSDDLNASQRGSSPTQDWIDDKLHEVCEDLGMTQDGHLNKKKLISICEYHGLKNVNKEVFEDIFHDLKPDGTMNMKDFFYSLFKNGKPLTTSASTPYRQVKRHLSMPSFDESGRRTITSSAITSSITFRLFSCLDDGMGYGSVEQILDIWNEEGIENGQEILKALDFSLDGSINLMELTLALENELLITKNGMHQAVLASFKTEIRHLLEQIDQVAREKEKLQSDIEKAEKLKSLLASEVDDHHAAIERQYEYNLRKLEEVYKEKITSFKNDNQKEREQILQQAGKQHLELEQEIEKVKTEENYIRDRLTFSLKENSRLESELLETTEKLAEYETLINNLQKNLDNVLSEKFHDLDPNIAEFFLQEERLTQMKTEYERRCRILQDQVDELQSELEEYRAQGKVFKLPFKKSLSQELDVRHHSTDLDQGFGSENCNPLNMSIEAELIIEQLKEQHHRDMKCLTLELKDKMLNYEKQLDETKVNCEKEQENVKQKYKNEIHTLEKQISALKSENAQLQKQTAILKKEQQETDCRYVIEKNELQVKLNEEKAHLQEKLKLEHEVALKNRLQQVEESFNREREGLIQNVTWAEEKMRDLVKAKEEEKCKLEEFYQEQLKSLMEKHTLEKEELQRKLLEKLQNKLQEERQESEKCQEENSILRKEITTLNEEGSISYLKLRELRGSQEEIWKKIETVRKEKIAIQKMVENFKKQVSELKTKNQHLDLKNANVIQKNTQNEADIRYLQHLAQILCQKEKEIGNSTLEEWGKQSSRLKEELDNCKAKSAKLSFLESKIATMKLEQKSWEDQNETLKSQLAASQEKVQNLDDCLQNANIQISQMNSDLQVTQQKNEALKQEVMSLQKQLKNVNGKNWLPERAICPSGLQDQLSWHKLDHPINQELELLMEENARLQIVVQNSTTEFMYSQEKVSQMNKLEEELETIHLENQSLKNKQVKVDEEMMEGSQKQLVIAMEERMLEVERKLKLVKRLLQEKVNQLKQQLCKNTKSDAVMKDLYVENNHLLKTLEITEQRQKTAEKKNYLLEEKIASLSNIIRNLTPAPVISAPPLSS
ncbi:ninein isoform X5 [Trichosurus vulpecula]|uniref:ninein isoform X5 n=1 Tax=Trichosurus vulpecula TaxID=9337 RepID=UPI00186ADBA2|nr:ninein isoform X5 [Trichosurus vulpecula]